MVSSALMASFEDWSWRQWQNRVVAQGQGGCATLSNDGSVSAQSSTDENVRGIKRAPRQRQRSARSHCADHRAAFPPNTHTRSALAQHGPNVAPQAWDVKPAPKAVQLTRAPSMPSSAATGLSCKTMSLSGRPGSAQVVLKLDEGNASETAGAGLAQDSAGGDEQISDDSPAAAGARGSAPG